MKRNVIEIDQDKCIGCGLCTKACHQGAIQLVDGKAKLMSDSYCDGLGMCLPNCPVDAIQLVEKETDAFDVSRKDFALKQNGSTASGCAGSQAKSFVPLAELGKTEDKPNLGCGCPGSNERSFVPLTNQKVEETNVAIPQSQLRQWPVQLHLVNVNAPYLAGANLLIAADCTPFAYADFHNKFMRGKVTLIGCPKLDDTNAYLEKLTEIFRVNNISSVSVVRMSVPCCGGITRTVQEAIKRSGAIVPYAEVTITPEGQLV